MSITYSLYNQQQAHKAMGDLWQRIKPYIAAGHRLQVTVRKQKKTRSQEEKYHAMIADIARAMQAAGSIWDEKSWKRLLIDQWASDAGKSTGDIAPSLDGERLVQLGIQSRDFNTEDAASFIEWLYAYAADKGIELAK